MPTDYRKYRGWFTVFVVVLIGGYIIAMAVYGEPFRFWKYPYSGLGATETENGFPNAPAMTIFIVDMLSVGIIYFRIGLLFAGDRRVPFRSFRIVFSFTAAFGACAAALPHNLFDLQHKLGSGFLVGSVWVLCIFFITDAAKVSSRQRTFFLHAILHAPVLAYAFAFATGSDLAHLFQKLAVAGIAMVILLSLGRLCRREIATQETAAIDESRVNS